MFEITFYVTSIYILFGLVFWEIIRVNDEQFKKEWAIHSWEYKAVLVVYWLPLLVCGTYAAIRDWIDK
jgi:hypothetical protein